jgi:ribose transport system substrate-binding protein
MNGKTKFSLVTTILIIVLLATACAPAATAQPTPQATPVPPTPITLVETVEVVKTVSVVQTVVVPAATTPPFDCKGKKLAYASFGSQFAFIAIVDKSVQEAAKKAGVDLLFLDNKFDAAQAVTNAETIASRGDIDAVLEFNYYQQQNYVIKDIFNSAKIPVIAIDIPIPGSVYYGADNYEAGRLAGLGLVDAAKAKWGDDSVDLVLVEQQSLAGQQELEKRTQGIVAGIKKALPNLADDKIIRFEGGANVDAAAEAVTTQLTAHPAAKHILVGMLGDSNAIAALNVAESAKRDVLASGIGGDDVGINALRTSKPAGFVGTTLFRPEMYGYDLIPLACDLLAGKQVPPDVYIKHVFLNAANLNEFYPK